jgi:signal transduction histidine kinase
VPKSHQDHGGVAKTVPVTPSGFDQAVDLGLGQVFAGAQVGVLSPPRWNCPVYGAWPHQPEMRFFHVTPTKARQVLFNLVTNAIEATEPVISRKRLMKIKSELGSSAEVLAIPSRLVVKNGPNI